MDAGAMEQGVTKEVRVGNVRIGGENPLILIAGPCVIESESSALATAKRLVGIARSAGIPLIFKASYDKANRTSIRSFRGPGLKKGLAVLRKVKDTFGIPVLSDVHCTEEVAEAGKVLDVIQIPAFLCRQTDLILAAASTGKAVNIKKGQFLAPWDMRHIVDKASSTGNMKIVLTERGASFGYNNLVSDFRSVIIMRRFGFPVVYDATHSIQMPGGLGDRSGGEREFIPYLSLAAVACGADGLFLEVHEKPERALSDGPNSVRINDLERILLKVKAVERAARGT